MKNISVINFIRCPSCKKDNFKQLKKGFRCLSCSQFFPIKDDILILVSEKNRKRILDIWNTESEYNQYEFFTTSRVSKLVRKYTNNSTVSLDVGCGAGAYQKDFKGSVISFDITPYFVKKAKKLFGKKNRIFIVADANEFPFKDNAFDLTFCSQVIEHFKEKQSNKLLENMIRSSKSYVSVDTPNDGNVFIHSLRQIIYGNPSEHEDEHLDHHRLVGRKDLEKFGFKTHSCIGYVSTHRFRLGPLWDIYDFIAWRAAGFGGNLIGFLDKAKIESNK